MATPMRVGSRMGKRMGLGFIIMVMAIVIRVNGREIGSKDKESSPMPMVINMLATLCREGNRVMASTHGSTGILIRASLRET